MNIRRTWLIGVGVAGLLGAIACDGVSGVADSPLFANAAINIDPGDTTVTAAAAYSQTTFQPSSESALFECVTEVDCDDRNRCTTDFCFDGWCLFAPVVCPVDRMCDSTSGECVECFEEADCDDQDLCTEDRCIEGECVFPPVDCEDGDLCTLDECIHGDCYSTDVVCQDDGLFCTGEEACDPSTGACTSEGDPCPTSLVCDEENDECVAGWRLILITGDAFDFDCKAPVLHNGQIAFQGGSDGYGIWFWDGTLVDWQPPEDSFTDIDPNGYAPSLHDCTVAYERKYDHVCYWECAGNAGCIPCSGNSEWPSVCDRQIAYVTGPSSNYNICLYDMDTETCACPINGPLVERSPDLCAGQIAYDAGATHNPPRDIYLWDGAVTHQITDTPQLDEGAPTLCCDGGIAWQGQDGSPTNDYEIFYRSDPLDPSTQLQITDNDTDDREPSCWHGTVAWRGWDGNDFEIYYWNGDFVQQVTDNEVDDLEPSLHAGWIAYSSWDGQSWRIMLAIPLNAGAGIITIQPGPLDGKDTMVRGATHADENYGEYPYVAIGKGSETPVDTLIEFDVSDVPAVGLTRTVLNLYAYEEWYSSGDTACLHGVPEEWDEMAATWDSEEQNIGALIECRVDDGVDKWYEWELPVQLVNQWLADPALNQGLRLTDPTHGYVEFRSSEFMDDPTQRPKLILEY